MRKSNSRTLSLSWMSGSDIQLTLTLQSAFWEQPCQWELKESQVTRFQSSREYLSNQPPFPWWIERRPYSWSNLLVRAAPKVRDLKPCDAKKFGLQGPCDWSNLLVIALEVATIEVRCVASKWVMTRMHPERRKTTKLDDSTASSAPLWKATCSFIGFSDQNIKTKLKSQKMLQAGRKVQKRNQENRSNENNAHKESHSQGKTRLCNFLLEGRHVKAFM